MATILDSATAELRISERAALVRALNNATRETLISTCVWNDPNGCYSDADCRAEDMPRASKKELAGIILGWADDDPCSFRMWRARVLRCNL